MALLRFLNEVHAGKRVTLNILATELLTDDLRGPDRTLVCRLSKGKETTKWQDIQSQKVSFGQGGPNAVEKFRAVPVKKAAAFDVKRLYEAQPHPLQGV